MPEMLWGLTSRAGESRLPPDSGSRFPEDPPESPRPHPPAKERVMKTNYVAVIVCAVAWWFLGALWYGLLFGQRWMALENITIEHGKSMDSALPYIATLVLDVLIAYALAQLCSWRNADTAGRGAAIGVLLWIGI